VSGLLPLQVFSAPTKDMSKHFSFAQINLRLEDGICSVSACGMCHLCNYATTSASANDIPSGWAVLHYQFQ